MIFIHMDEQIIVWSSGSLCVGSRRHLWEWVSGRWFNLLTKPFQSRQLQGQASCTSPYVWTSSHPNFCTLWAESFFKATLVPKIFPILVITDPPSFGQLAQLSHIKSSTKNIIYHLKEDEDYYHPRSVRWGPFLSSWASTPSSEQCTFTYTFTCILIIWYHYRVYIIILSYDKMMH